MRDTSKLPRLILFYAGLLALVFGVVLAVNQSDADDAVAATLLVVGLSLSCAFVVLSAGD